MSKPNFKITLSPELSEDFFHTSLCNAVSMGYGQYYIDDTSEESQGFYKKAKQSIKDTFDKIGATSNICIEDVWVEILRQGDFLQFRDKEENESLDRKIYLKDVHEKVQNSPIRALVDMKEETGDVETADLIIQTVLYGEIIFG